MGEFVFPETIKRMGQWGAGGAEERKLKEREIKSENKSVGKESLKETILGSMSHNNLSQELSISQVGLSSKFNFYIKS